MRSLLFLLPFKSNRFIISAALPVSIRSLRFLSAVSSAFPPYSRNPLFPPSTKPSFRASFRASFPRLFSRKEACVKASPTPPPEPALPMPPMASPFPTRSIWPNQRPRSPVLRLCMADSTPRIAPGGLYMASDSPRTKYRRWNSAIHTWEIALGLPYISHLAPHAPRNPPSISELPADRGSSVDRWSRTVRQTRARIIIGSIHQWKETP